MEIKNAAQRRRAIIEDEIVDLLLKQYETFVMHGGTAVWRCYGGNRFSRDVDFYCNLNPSGESALQKQLHKLLIDNGYSIREEKYNNKTKTLHVIFRGTDTTGKLDIAFANAKGIATEYTRVDGSKRMIRALSPEAMLMEKINAYSEKFKSQNHEAQDLYDIVILKDKISGASNGVRKEIAAFIAKIKDKPPKGEKELKLLLLSGPAPNFSDMIGILERWVGGSG